MAYSETIWSNVALAIEPLSALVVCVLLLVLIYQRLCNLRLARSNEGLIRRETMSNRLKEAAGIAWFIYSFTRKRWETSDPLCRLLDLPDGVCPDAVLKSMMYTQTMAQIWSTFRGHRHDPEPYTIEFEIVLSDSKHRLLRAVACNEFLADRSLSAISAIVKDVTEEYERVAAIERDRIHAIEEARQARILANTDQLTGLPNRRSLMNAMDRFIKEAREVRAPLALVIFDIDRFKAVNDTHGHLAGDAILRRVAQIASDQVRKGDMIGRIGGEEFAWLLRGSGAERVAQAAERLRWAIEMRSATSDVAAVTISAGYAQLEEGDTSLTLFANADAALYEAKRAGRNTILEAA